jgi:hypothetical protein
MHSAICRQTIARARNRIGKLDIRSPTLVGCRWIIRLSFRIADQPLTTQEQVISADVTLPLKRFILTFVASGEPGCRAAAPYDGGTVFRLRLSHAGGGDQQRK